MYRIQLHVAYRQDFNIHPKPRPMGQGLQLVGRRKDGTLVPVEISLSPVYRNEELMVTAIVRDITAHLAGGRRFRSLFLSVQILPPRYSLPRYYDNHTRRFGILYVRLSVILRTYNSAGFAK